MTPGRPSPYVFFLALCALPAACNLTWPASMDDQPPPEPLEAPRAQPPSSVPVGGVEVLKDRDDVEKTRNPYAGDPRASERGARVFASHCVTCHGPEGRGDGAFAKIFPAPDLHDNLTCERTDGFLYGTLTAGGMVMPPVREGLSSRDRWDAVSFVRELQRQGCFDSTAAGQQGGGK